MKSQALVQSSNVEAIASSEMGAADVHEDGDHPWERRV